MQPFMDLRSLTPRPGRLKCVWVPGADGRLESIWVPDWERDLDLSAETPAEVQEVAQVQPLRRVG